MSCFCISLSARYCVDRRGRKRKFKARIPGTYCFEIYTTRKLILWNNPLSSSELLGDNNGEGRARCPNGRTAPPAPWGGRLC